ncbi:MAG: 30S ribosomal protein S24e [Candidatus Hodarchaeales archaeon]|jgi:small subunit ribosomal protein S24e
MEITITEEKENSLIGRKEIQAVITHLGDVTPTREAVRAKIAAQINADLDRVVVQSIDGHFGEPKSQLTVHCYDSSETVLVYEPKYILKRNKIISTESDES